MIFCSTFVSRQKWNKEKNRIFAKLNFTAMHTAKANSITIETPPLTGGAEPVYYFHSDHLGSASWITNNAGLPVQHLLYLPFGEHFVNERSAAYDERFTFTGKERDAETGYYYHGARFNSSDIGWLSVDPMADKYPSLSPYAYCAWNPVKLVDIQGWDTTYYNLKANKLFTRYGGENINMMIVTDEIINSDKYNSKDCHSFDVRQLILLIGIICMRIRRMTK